MNDALRPLRAMPPIERLAEGLWSLPVPLPIDSLRYVYTYVLESPSGAYLVDTGWDTPEAWSALCAGLEHIGYGVADVQGILVTHAHPDHYGLAGRIQEQSGCWIGMHPREADVVRRQADETDSGAGFGSDDYMRQAGVPQHELRRLSSSGMPNFPKIDLVQPDRLIEDGESVDIPEWDIRAVWTPGHTPGHLCFHLPELGALLSGDHVLPRITPNISYQVDGNHDPLSDFLHSLAKVADLAPDVVYPAHEYRFVGIAERVSDIVRHHQAHLDEILALLQAGAVTLWDVTSRMSWSGRWDSFDMFRTLSALSEAAAHLRTLQTRGLVTQLPGNAWRLAPVS
jgi:glyoxylase-like metal-dependent hydrolase (beta-lactamase superfamily II)